MSSKISNDEVHSGTLQQREDEEVAVPDQTIPLIDPPHLWET